MNKALVVVVASRPWVRAAAEESHFGVAVTKGFARLYEYISGANEDSKKLKMTSPVRLPCPSLHRTPGDPPVTRVAAPTAELSRLIPFKIIQEAMQGGVCYLPRVCARRSVLHCEAAEYAL